MSIESAESALRDPHVQEAVRRGIIAIEAKRVTYQVHHTKSYDWRDPEEWVRAATLAWLVVDREYPAVRIKMEVTVPRRTPSDSADIVVYRDDRCTEIYLVVENKASGQRGPLRTQAIEQLFGNANSLRAPLGLYDEGGVSAFFNVAGFPQTERTLNRLGTREALPKQYDETPTFVHIAGAKGDISPVASGVLEAKIRRAHSIIWAGGKRDPLTAFEEWSKMLFAKVTDERATPNGQPRRFQVGTEETSAAVANRIHLLFREACKEDPDIFGGDIRIALPDNKVSEVVRVLQDVAFVRTDADTIGRAFEQFFGSIFRGGLGQYFTMRQLARFTVGMLDIQGGDYILDPTSGSGGFLLEVLLQTWHRLDRQFDGQPERERRLLDFARTHVYGIELHDVLARICKINLLLHHDGHTNIEAGRTCLDVEFSKARLRRPLGRFTRVVGNPPFGDTVDQGDDEKLGASRLEDFRLAESRSSVDSEQIILERCVDFLEGGGRLGLILPDGLFNNQGEASNCPRTRRFLASSGRIEAIISLPDHAFRKSGAQNKTSILFFRKFTDSEQRAFGAARDDAMGRRGLKESEAIPAAIEAAGLSYHVFLAEANQIGYSGTGQLIADNDLYRAASDGKLSDAQSGTILGEWQVFQQSPTAYAGRTQPDCMSVAFNELWSAHPSHRLDPKYHLFVREARRALPEGWVRRAIRDVMARRMELAQPEAEPDRHFLVMTIAQTGDIRPRVAGKGKAPPEWRGTYFEDSKSTWYAAAKNDVVYSSIDLWKGCIALVPDGFAGGLVTKEFPIYQVVSDALLPAFLQSLLRTRYYQRAFRAITTGHSNRRRTQQEDFEALEIAFPVSLLEQERLVSEIVSARGKQQAAGILLRQQMNAFSDLIDGRGDEELPEIEGELVDDDE